ncbi:MAG TPA: 4-(cytidine 5'-diphospho)-2-C-methyl-D-erythritol kinase [Flavobacteriales bacterium]
MVVFPYAKINLGLHVLGRRSDGYHTIESIMVPVPLRDALEAIVDPELPDGQVRMTRSGIPVPGDPDDDLCSKAARWLGAQQQLPGVRMHLHKAIPIGAGLGGGSSDGTHTLLLLNRLLGLGLASDVLHQAASALGSDPPFFLHEGIQFIEGRGERTTVIEADLKGTWLLLVNPGIHVSTAEVYRHCHISGSSGRLLEAFRQRRWAELTNDLEPFVFDRFPAVAAIKQQLQRSGAFFSAMSGSGSTVFGLYHREPTIPDFPAEYLVRRCRL